MTKGHTSDSQPFVSHSNLVLCCLCILFCILVNVTSTIWKSCRQVILGMGKRKQMEPKDAVEGQKLQEEEPEDGSTDPSGSEDDSDRR